MQFKQRKPGGRVQLWVYDGFDPVKSRPKTRMLGSFLPDQGPTPDLLASLTPEQRTEINQWIAQRRAAQQHLNKQGFIDFCAGRMRNTAIAIADPETKLTAAKAAEIWAQMDALGKALRKAGFPKASKSPQKATEANSDADPSQPKLKI